VDRGRERPTTTPRSRKGAADFAPWLDLNAASTPPTEGSLTGGQWARLGVAAAVWVLAPLVLGTMRAFSREVA